MIYLVRHGQTDDNKNHIIQGNNPLNDVGKQQVQDTAEMLKDVKFDVCYCSPMKRTVQTLEIIAKHHKNMPIIYDERLKERDYGNLVGICYDTIKQYSDIRWNSNYTINETVETPIQLFERVSGFYEDILNRYKGKNILIVAHSGIARMTYFYFNGKPENGDYSNFEIKNAHVMQIEN